MLNPIVYRVRQIDGDYAVLETGDTSCHDFNRVALALLPLETDEGMTLLWENFEYRILTD